MVLEVELNRFVHLVSYLLVSVNICVPWFVGTLRLHLASRIEMKPFYFTVSLFSCLHFHPSRYKQSIWKGRKACRKWNACE